MSGGLCAVFIRTVSFQELVNDHGMILDGSSSGGPKIIAALSPDGSIAFIDSPRGEVFKIDRRRILSRLNKEFWFDPR